MLRPLRIIAWSAFVGVQASLHIWPDHLMRIYSASMMLATAGGAIMHGLAGWRGTGHARRVWAITSVGLACWAYAEISVGVDAVLTNHAAPRSLAGNILNLGALVCAVAAMLSIPTAPRTLCGRMRMIFDGVITSSALMGTAWILVLKSMTGYEAKSEAVFDLSYPIVASGVLAVGLVLLSGQTLRQFDAMTAITGGVVVLTAILLLEVVGNTLDLPGLRPYVLGGYIASAVLMALSSRAPMPAGGERTWQPSTAVGSAMPYLPVIMFTLVATGYLISGRLIDVEVAAAALVMVAAVLARQFLELRLNARLTRELAEERSRYAAEATHDGLTRLPNRTALTSALADTGPAALLLIDLDGFKAVNDTLGHGAGDELLTIVAGRIRAAAGAGRLPARLGGDEFAVLLPGAGLDEARALAHTILTVLNEPMSLTGFPASVGASIGVAACQQEAAQRLLRDADLALYDVKHNGKGAVRVFDRALAAIVEERRALQNDLGRVIADGQLNVVYQPIVELVTGASHGCEALVRWLHPECGQLSPDLFLPAAREAGLLVEIDHWVLSTAVAQLAAWRAVDPSYTVAVNVSITYLASGRIVDDVRRALTACGLPGSALTVDVTETSLIADIDSAVRTLVKLRALGVRVALDDFGVGYSSLTHLRTLPVDIVKMDRSFIRQIGFDAQAAILVEAVLGLVRALGMDCIVEGVEEQDQLDRLRELRCDRAQGYLLAWPQTAAEIPMPEMAVREMAAAEMAAAEIPLREIPGNEISAHGASTITA